MEFTGFDSLDLTNVEAGDSYLKAGQFRCEVVKASVEQNKAKTGRFVKVEMKCMDGNGVTVDRFNVQNANPKAVEIGLQKLKKFLIETGHPNPDKPGDINSLSGLKVVVNLKRGDDFVTDTGERREGRGEIVGYARDVGQRIAGAAVTAAPASHPPVVTDGTDQFPDDIPF
ncbi:DUF669 domain-containing protein [Endozoicomonas atrinae]|uniref:DUF669 domain-containing protein n=1 Tax=Endozoicomonas atrinae TaxID=1333660 RepID=UPI0008265B73|nr:DUF669 domain-containing protein [Endozoicomonas atrinae]